MFRLDEIEKMGIKGKNRKFEELNKKIQEKMNNYIHVQKTRDGLKAIHFSATEVFNLCCELFKEKGFEIKKEDIFIRAFSKGILGEIIYEGELMPSDCWSAMKKVMIVLPKESSELMTRPLVEIRCKNITLICFWESENKWLPFELAVYEEKIISDN